MTSNAANLSVNADLISEARNLEIDPSSAAETGIADAIKAERERRWKLENAEAIQAENAHIEKHGLPLAKYRQF